MKNQEQSNNSVLAMANVKKNIKYHSYHTITILYLIKIPSSGCPEMHASQIQVMQEFLDPQTHEETFVLVPVW